MKEKSENTVTFFKMILFILISAHFMAILYHTTAQLDIYMFESDLTWLHTMQISDETKWVRYLYSYFMASQSMVTNNSVFTPKTKLEMSFVIFAAFYNSGIFCLMVNLLGQIITNVQRKQTVTKHDLKVLDRYMTKKKINKDL